MNRIAWIGILPAAMLLASCKGKKEEVVSPVIAPITEAVFAPGHLEAGNQFNLTAMNDGYILDVRVSEGDTVQQGQVLFVQDSSPQAIQQQAATENLRIAESNAAANSAILQQLELQLRSAEEKMNNDKGQSDRMQRLYKTNSVARIDADNALLAWQTSANNVAAIRQNIAATRISLSQSVINSRSQQQTAVVNSGYAQIKSPGRYNVLSLLKRKGELLRKGEAVAILGDNRTQIISMTVDESSIRKVARGMPVLIALNTDKGRTYTGSVSKIYPLFDAASQAYKAEAVFDTLPSGLIAGTLLQANIIVGRKEKALLIPRGCLSLDGEVILQKSGKPDTVKVTTGIISTEWVEVLKGINLQDRLIKAY